MMYQHFSGHPVKQLFAAIRSLWATNSHWRNEDARGYKTFDIFKHRLFGVRSGLIGLMMYQFGF
ncbi:MAG: hypothetical protein PHF31_16995 [Methylobacter sp.]|nr:hypothetical protein [Methylobacter sp.]